MTEIIEGVHLFESIGCNVYFIEDERALIDTGFKMNGVLIEKELENIGFDPRDLELILLTHAHLDHAGSAQKLREKSNAKIAIHKGDAPYASGEENYEFLGGILGGIVNFVNYFLNYKSFEPNLLLEGGEKVGNFQILHFPGHTPGSVAYLYEDMLFSGDLLVRGRLPFRKGKLTLCRERSCFSFSDYLKSIERLKDLNLGYESLMPAHGEPILKNAKKKVNNFLKKRLRY